MGKKEKKVEEEICCECGEKPSYYLAIWTITCRDFYKIDKNGVEEYIGYSEKILHDKGEEHYYYCKKCYKALGLKPNNNN